MRVGFVATRWYNVHMQPFWYGVNTRLDRIPMQPVQIRMARAAVGWGVRELAEKAGVTANTVTRIENGADAKQSTMSALRAALEGAGVVFLSTGETIDGGPGVRLRKEGTQTEKL